MPRPPKCRWVGEFPPGVVFKPLGYPMRLNGVGQLSLDELEALRQAHALERTQEEGAEAMGISRSTFGRILESAHRKVTDALLNCKTLTIDGGPVIMDKRQFHCRDCGHIWDEPFGTGRPGKCPACSSINLQRSDAGPRRLGLCRGAGRGRRGVRPDPNVPLKEPEKKEKGR